MLVVRNRRFKKQHVIGGAGIFDSIFKFLVKTFTSSSAKQIASSAAKEVGKAALEAGKSVAVDAGKKQIEKTMQPKSTKKVESITSKYIDNTAKGSAFAIQDLVKRLSGSGLKSTIYEWNKKNHYE